RCGKVGRVAVTAGELDGGAGEEAIPLPFSSPRLTVIPGNGTKLLALAHRFEAMLREGGVISYAELAQLGRVTPARASHVLALPGLAPDIQEAILFLPRTGRGRDPLQMYDLLPLTTVLDWRVQRRLWQQLPATRSCG